MKGPRRSIARRVVAGIAVAGALSACAKGDFSLACEAVDEMTQEYTENMFFVSTDGEPTFAFETAYDEAKSHAAIAAKGADPGTPAARLNVVLKEVEGQIGLINQGGAAGTIVATAWTDETYEICHGQP